jgi:hypothetical protein
VRKAILAAVLLAICPLLFAQQPLNNDSVIKLVKAGLSEDLIVSTINGSAGTYDTSAEGLIALKQASVSDKVVTAIVLKASGSSAPASGAAPATAAPGANPDDPAAAHEAGIYIYSDSAPARSKMTMLEPNVYTQGKTGGVFASAMTYGIAKVKMKAVLRGAHANARVSDPQPVRNLWWHQYAQRIHTPSLRRQRCNARNDHRSGQRIWRIGGHRQQSRHQLHLYQVAARRLQGHTQRRIAAWRVWIHL